MPAGGFHEAVLTAAWPSGEFGGMGLEGAARLGYRRELEAVADPAEREALFASLAGTLYAEGKAINMASCLEVDAVIDPRDTRAWLLRGLGAARNRRERAERHFVDTWREHRKSPAQGYRYPVPISRAKRLGSPSQVIRPWSST
jgi:acetyl-CoA carboxylase carboxyltransferase component